MNFVIADNFDDILKHEMDVKILEVNVSELTDATKHHCTSMLKDQRTANIIEEQTGVKFYCNPDNPSVFEIFPKYDTLVFVVKRRGSTFKTFLVSRTA